MYKLFLFLALVAACYAVVIGANLGASSSSSSQASSTSSLNEARQSRGEVSREYFLRRLLRCLFTPRCPREAKPVCGNDGRTYLNGCVLVKATCGNKQLRLVTEHACRGRETPVITFQKVVWEARKAFPDLSSFDDEAPPQINGRRSFEDSVSEQQSTERSRESGGEEQLDTFRHQQPQNSLNQFFPTDEPLQEQNQRQQSNQQVNVNFRSTGKQVQQQQFRPTLSRPDEGRWVFAGLRHGYPQQEEEPYQDQDQDEEQECSCRAGAFVQRQSRDELLE